MGRSSWIDEDKKARLREQVRHGLERLYPPSEVRRIVIDRFDREAIKVTGKQVDQMIREVMAEMGVSPSLLERADAAGIRAWRRECQAMALEHLYRVALSGAVRRVTKRSPDGEETTTNEVDAHCVGAAARVAGELSKITGTAAKVEIEATISGSMNHFLGPSAPIRLDQMDDDELRRVRDLCGTLREVKRKRLK